MNYKSALLSPGIGLEDWTSGALGWEERSSEDAAPGTETRRQDQGRWEVPNLNLAIGAPAFFSYITTILESFGPSPLSFFFLLLS